MNKSDSMKILNTKIQPASAGVRPLGDVPNGMFFKLHPDDQRTYKMISTDVSILVMELWGRKRLCDFEHPALIGAIVTAWSPPEM